MDCAQTSLLLTFVRARELDQAEQAALERHLENCSGCAALAKAEQRFDRAMGQAMRAVPVPPGLHDSILRRMTPKPRWRPVPWLAAAATVLLAVGVSIYWAQHHRPTFDYARFEDSFVIQVANNPEDVESWFADQGLTMVAPRHFNFQLLNNYETAQIQGRRVARLTFFSAGNNQQRAGLAQVYVVPEKQLLLPQDAIQRHPGSTHTMEIMRFPGIEDFYYIVIYTAGASLESFLQQGGV